MRKYTFVFLLLTISIVAIYSCEKKAEAETKIILISGDLSFDDITVNEYISKTFTIKNDGTGPVNISNIVSPQGFSVDWLGGTIESGRSQQVNVKFTPTEPRFYSGQIKIQSDASTSLNTIQVSGKGKANIVDYSTYKNNYFSVDNSSYIQASLPASSPQTSTSPTIRDVQGNSYVLTGGSNIINFRSSNTVSYVIIGIQGVDGYYKINESSLSKISTNYYTFNLAIPQNLILQSISFRIAYVDINGLISNYYILNASEIKAGTGLLQINCTWLNSNDIDLHVIEPNGEEIYFDNRISTNKGELDIDAYAGCGLPYWGNENVTYKNGALVEAGRYIVKANLWSACDVIANTPVTLSAWYNGERLKDANGKTDFTINFSPSDANKGGIGAGKEVIYVNIARTQTAQRSVMPNNVNSITVVAAENTKAEKSNYSQGKLFNFDFDRPISRNAEEKVKKSK